MNFKPLKWQDSGALTWLRDSQDETLKQNGVFSQGKENSFSVLGGCVVCRQGCQSDPSKNLFSNQNSLNPLVFGRAFGCPNVSWDAVGKGDLASVTFVRRSSSRKPDRPRTSRLARKDTGTPETEHAKQKRLANEKQAWLILPAGSQLTLENLVSNRYFGECTQCHNPYCSK